MSRLTVQSFDDWVPLEDLWAIAVLDRTTEEITSASRGRDINRAKSNIGVCRHPAPMAGAARRGPAQRAGTPIRRRGERPITTAGGRFGARSAQASDTIARARSG